MRKNKGITLIALVITIIVLLILAGTATYVGYDAIETSREQRKLAELKAVNEAVNFHKNDYETLGLNELETSFTADGVEYNYKLETEEDYKKIGLYDIYDVIYVNFEIGQIYSKDGINGKHTLKDFGIEYYTPELEQTEEIEKPTFTILTEQQGGPWKYVIADQNITCNGNIEDGYLLYSEYDSNENYKWKRVSRNVTSNGYELVIKNPGTYVFKYVDAKGHESDIEEIVCE